MTFNLIVGTVIAAGAWGAMFVPRRDGFWTRASLAATVIGVFALAAEPAVIGQLFDRRHWAGDVVVGILGGGALYVVFWVGEQALVIIAPKLAAEVGDLYTVRGRTRPGTIPVVVAIAGAGEELFFRGLLQRQAGVAVALAVYGAVHLWERKIILVVAALAGGVWWGVLLAWTGGLIAPVVSHVLWGLAIIVWRPARPTAWAQRTGGRFRAAFGR